MKRKPVRPYFKNASSGKLKRFLTAFRGYLEKYTLEFASDAQRLPDEFGRSGLYRFGFEIVIGITIALFSISLFGPTIKFQLTRWTSSKPAVGIEQSRWIVSFDEPGDCSDVQAAGCISNPTSGALWRSLRRLSDKDFSVETQRAMGRKFWIGLELSSEEILSAHSRKASVLEIALFNSAYKVYVDGVLADSGSGFDSYAATVALPMELLAKQKPIRIAVEVEHNLNSRIPVWMPTNFGGLYSFESSRSHRDLWISLASYRGIIIVSWSVLLASIFFFLWIYVPRKVEYFFYSCYLFNFALLNFVQLAPVSYGSDRGILYIGTFWLVVSECALGALIGAAYARARKLYLFWILSINALIAVSAFISSKNSTEIYWYKEAFLKFNAPLMLFLGACFCFSQFVLLGVRRPKLMNPLDLKLRRRRLRLFGVSLIAMGVIFFIQSIELMSTTPQFVHSSIQLLLILMIGLLLLSEFRDREKQFEIIQRSPYHDPFGAKSAEVFGYLVSIDLIRSSILTNFAAANNSTVKPITAWNVRVGEIMSRNFGYKVADEGDGLKVFFNVENTISELEKVVFSLIEVENATAQLQFEMRQAQLIPMDGELKFRTGIIWGGINPIWKSFLGVKSAEWEDAKGSTSFKDVTRIMDSEKFIRSSIGEGSFALILTDMEIEKLESKLPFRRLKLEIKDMGQRELVILELKDEREQAIGA